MNMPVELHTSKVAVTNRCGRGFVREQQRRVNERFSVTQDEGWLGESEGGEAAELWRADYTVAYGSMNPSDANYRLIFCGDAAEHAMPHLAEVSLPEHRLQPELVSRKLPSGFR